MAYSTAGFPEEFDQIMALAGAMAHPADARERGEWPQYLYRPASVLARQADAARVRNALVERGLDLIRPEEVPADDPGDSERRRRFNHEDDDAAPGVVVIPGLVLFSWAQRDRTVPEELDELDVRLGVGVARPDHVLVVASHGCPYGEPSIPPVPTPFPPVTGGARCTGEGVVVGVVDTGLAPGYTSHPWLADGVTGDADPMVVQDPKGAKINYLGGHGTMAAGVLRAVAPHARVRVEASASLAADDPVAVTYESRIGPRVLRALDEQPDILVITYATQARGDLPLLGLDVAFDRARQQKDLVILAPAGNAGLADKHFPAASPGVIGVGALRGDGSARAGFSNYGPWVDVYAPGENLVNAFATGTYTYLPPGGGTADFTGLARWSGTSFSTPIVAGLIAGRMSATGESARVAAEGLLAFARSQRVAGAGPVLLPDQACRGVREACDHGGTCCCSRGHGAHRCGCGREGGGMW